MAAHHHRAGRKPAFAFALAITMLYAIVELAGGLWSQSLALISDAGHMFSDGLALGVAAVAAWFARRPAGERHSYGWARAEVIGAMLNGLLMLPVVVLLVVEAVQRLMDPRSVMAAGVIVIAFIGLLINVAVACALSRSAHNLNARAALVHVLSDLVSSLAALVAGAVIYVTGWLLIDPILSLVIAGLILMTTLRLLRDTLHVLMEGVPAAVGFSEIGNALAAIPGVMSVHDLHVWGITPESVTLSAHMEIEKLEDWPRILALSRRLLHERFAIDHVTLQPEAVSTGIPREAIIKLWPRKTRQR
ncbi:MAG: cation diffusion facilitator family transporter [Betaproteobacteria bacterium]